MKENKIKIESRINTLKEKIYDQDVFIMGGGYSVKLIPETYIEMLKNSDKLVLSLNSCIYDYPNSIAVGFTDSGWLSKNSEKIDKLKGIEKIYFNQMSYKEDKNAFKYIRIKKTYKNELAPQMDMVGGNNTGANSINFLLNLGARRIFLFGFDCKKINKKSHHHSYYKKFIPDSVYSDTFKKCFHEMFINEKKKNRIINLSTNTNLRCFNIDDYKKFL